jgi:BlaI family transcriptional regulator, penicillinase repressor
VIRVSGDGRNVFYVNRLRLVLGEVSASRLTRLLTVVILWLRIVVIQGVAMSSSIRRSPRPLSPAQREIMEILWDRGELTAAMVRQVLSEDRQLARNTVRTMLQRMEEKGWLKHRSEGRTFLFSPAVPRAVTIGQRVLELVESLCGGSPEALMTALLEHRGLTTEETKRIREMLDSAEPHKDRS